MTLPLGLKLKWLLPNISIMDNGILLVSYGFYYSIIVILNNGFFVFIQFIGEGTLTGNVYPKGQGLLFKVLLFFRNKINDKTRSIP